MPISRMSNWLRRVVNNDTPPATSTQPAGATPVGPSDGLDPANVRNVYVGDAIPAPQTQAVVKFKSLMQSGKLQSYYDAYNGKVDDPQLKAEAVALFKELPTIDINTDPAKLVALGLITTAPKGIDFAQKSPRYLPGRQVMVRTTLQTQDRSNGVFGTYDPNGNVGITHKASILGEEGDKFLIQIDGSDDPIKLSKKEIYELNQPQVFPERPFTLNGVKVDYAHEGTKAKLCEALIKMDPHLSQIDFTKSNQDSSTGVAAFFTGGGAAKTQGLQEKCVRAVHDVIKMRYSHDMNRGDEVGVLAMGSDGQCYSQAAVNAALLNPLTKLLGVDMRFINGRVFRNASGDPPFNGGNHGWLQVTYRPSMETKITDRTWMQASISMDRAYSFAGDRWPFGLINPNGRTSLAKVEATDLEFSGDAQLHIRDRDHGVAGRDDRSNHMRNNQ
ncbi:MAG: hypothetical protein QGI45_02675 [Myxococcota bacterium]|nr:hypothetical protein [Myxococcota bacterium]